MVSPVASHVGQRHQLVVEQKVRDFPWHRLSKRGAGWREQHRATADYGCQKTGIRRRKEQRGAAEGLGLGEVTAESFRIEIRTGTSEHPKSGLTSGLSS
jgi:hypothetical protein